VGAANLANVLNPQAVILGGFFPHLAEWIMPTARAAFAGRAFGPAHQIGELAVSRLGLSAATRGAAALLIDQVVSDPTRLSVPVLG
jgi:predicted NBD/HSP70 family sugar kinase